MTRLIQNAIMTPDGTILKSRHRHDYQVHTDTKTHKEYMVDGGLDYSRRSAHGDEVDLCEYDTAPHEVQRTVIDWGSYGKDGKGPLKWIPIKDMETTHIEAVLKECKPMKVIRECMERELEYRKTL